MKVKRKIDSRHTPNGVIFRASDESSQIHESDSVNCLIYLINTHPKGEKSVENLSTHLYNKLF